MKGECTICGHHGEVREVVTAKAFMEQLVGHKTDKLITCNRCTGDLLRAIKQAIGIIQERIMV